MPLKPVILPALDLQANSSCSNLSSPTPSKPVILPEHTLQTNYYSSKPHPAASVPERPVQNALNPAEAPAKKTYDDDFLDKSWNVLCPDGTFETLIGKLDAIMRWRHGQQVRERSYWWKMLRLEFSNLSEQSIEQNIKLALDLFADEVLEH